MATMKSETEQVTVDRLADEICELLRNTETRPRDMATLAQLLCQIGDRARQAYARTLTITVSEDPAVAAERGRRSLECLLANRRQGKVPDPFRGTTEIFMAK